MSDLRRPVGLSSGSPDASLRSTRLDAVELSIRASRIIRRMGCETLDDLCALTADDLLANKCFGMTSLYDVREMLARYGLALAGEGKKPAPDPFAEFKAFLAAPREHLHLPLYVLDLCPVLADRLRGVGFVTVSDVLDADSSGLRQLFGFAFDQVLELEERLALYGLSLASPHQNVAAIHATQQPSVSV